MMHLTQFRGILALLVVTVHGSQQFLDRSSSEYVYRIFDLGKHGVAGFFTLSAFLLSSNLRSSSLNAGSISKYALKRFIRIAPAFYVCLLVLSAIQRVNGQTVLLHILFLFNTSAEMFGSMNYAFWSISVEMSFYIALPFLILALRKYKTIHLAATMCVIGIAWQFVSGMGRTFSNFDANLDWAARFYLVAALPAFAFGLVLTDSDAKKTRLLRIALINGLVLVIADVALRIASPLSASIRGWSYSLDSVLDGSLGFYAYGSLAYMIIDRHTGSGTLQRGGELADWLGQRSFSIYLWHLPIMIYCAANLPSVVAAPFALVCSFAVAELSFSYVEVTTSRYLRNRWMLN